MKGMILIGAVLAEFGFGYWVMNRLDTFFEKNERET